MNWGGLTCYNDTLFLKVMEVATRLLTWPLFASIGFFILEISCEAIQHPIEHVSAEQRLCSIGCMLLWSRIIHKGTKAPEAVLNPTNLDRCLSEEMKCMHMVKLW